jgi:hypothetical protein
LNGFFLTSALVGTTLIVVRGTLFKRLQQLWPVFFRCAQCVGMWVGAAAGASGIAPMGHGRVVDGLIVGAATSFLSLLAEAVLVKLLGGLED